MSATRETKTPGIPEIREDNVLDVLRAIKATMEVREGRSGDPLDEGATLRDLADLGLADPNGVTDGSGGGKIPVGIIAPSGPGDGYDPDKDLTTPPAPTNLQVVGGFAALYLTWDGAPYRNHAYTEVYRNSVDVLLSTETTNGAVLVGTSIASGYTDPAEPDTEFWYWIRFVSRANITGPWNSTSGTSGRTAIDVEKIIKVLSDEIVRSGLMQELSQRIDKIDVDAYIAGRSVNSTLDSLTARIDTNSSRILELHSVTATQATSLQVLESKGPSGNRTFFSPDRPDDSVNGVVAGTALILNDIWYDTNDNNRSYKWTDPGQWTEFIVAGVKVYHQDNDPASFDGTHWVDSTGRLMLQGDLWYDSGNADHSYFWSSATNTWVDNTAVDNTAEIVTLEQTKIGYATLNENCQFGTKGSVFDNGGVIWNNVDSTSADYANSAKKWNVEHTNAIEKVTWHRGIPFAQSVKQVGVTTSTGGNATLQNKMEAYQTTDDKLLAQYTVKLDVNGYVAGFGLASWQNNDLTHASLFIVNADKFAIGPAYPNAIWNGAIAYAKHDIVKMSGGNPPVVHVFQARRDVPANQGHTPTWGAYRAEDDPWWTDLSARLPFIATSTGITIDGHDYPPGVWMPTANIAEASIVSAKIGSLVADKITSGTIVANTSISVNGWIYGGLNPTSNIPGPHAGNGFFLGVHGGSYKFFVGNSNTDYIYWQGTTFEVKGTIIGTAGSIGGINMSYAVKGDSTTGRLYTNGVSGFDTGASGFWLDYQSKFRIGNPAGARLVWDGDNLVIYNSSGVGIFATGNIANGMSWEHMEGNPPDSVNNNNIGIANGSAPGTIIRNNVPGSSATGVVMPGNPITSGNVGTYIAAAAITDAYIGNRIQSYNWDGSMDNSGNITATGTIGWCIDKAGNAVFNGVLVTAKVQTGSILIDGDSGQQLLSAASGSWNGTTDWGANIVWDPATRLHGPYYHAYVPIRTRVHGHTTDVAPLIINFSGTVDHNLSLWVKRNEDPWTYLGTVLEPQPDYGSISFNLTGLSHLDYYDYMDFGFSTTNGNMVPINWSKTAVRNFSFSVMMFNI